MEMREELGIACSMMMFGAALATLSSLTGLGYIERVGAMDTLVIGLLVLAMVAGACRVLVKSDRMSALVASVIGMVTAVVGWLLVEHLFLAAFPGFYVLSALVAAAFPRHAGGATLTSR